LTYDKAPFSGPYFISIYGTSDCYYSITPVVTRKVEEVEIINYQLLTEGIHFKNKFSNGEDH